MQFGEETISKEQIYQGAILDLELHHVKLQDGKQVKREIIRHAPAVAVVAINNDDKMIFVRQYRKAIEKAILEVPAGLVDDNEALLIAAQREFAEEIGLAAKEWHKLDSFFVTPGYDDEVIHMYACSDLYPYEGNHTLDEDEHIEIINLNITEAQEAIERGEICDMKTIYAIQYWQLIKKDETSV